MVFGDDGRRSPARADGTHDINIHTTSSLLSQPQPASTAVGAAARSNDRRHSSQSSPFGDEKIIATGNGITVGLLLAEPILFLQGFDQNEPSSGSTAMLRGSLLVHVTKQVKLKSISLNFRGKAETDWPEGIPPRKTDVRDSENVISHTWPFFNALFPQAEYGYCADFVHLAKCPSVSTKEIGVTGSTLDRLYRSASPRADTMTRENNRLSLQTNQSRSFGKGEAGHAGPTVAQKGFKIFYPGDFMYTFELPVDSRLPESISVALGSVKYELEAVIERASTFRPNVVGSKELLMIRAPAEGSLEQVEPIAISRNWEDQLHYEIVISGKAFPLGASVPIAFKLTPLAKVQCHRLKVYMTENIQYFTANKRVHRLEPTSQVQLFEKRADTRSSSTYPGSSLRVSAGGGIPWDDREAAARGEEIVQPDATNLLGDLDYDDTSVGPTEMELNVQLPSCHEMKDRPSKQKLHFDTTYQNIQVNHWIKIVMRLSKPDNSNAGRRRHFEVSIDSPVTILSCRATTANTSLPAYTTGKSPSMPADESDCGCPGAATRTRAAVPTSPMPVAAANDGNALNSSESPIATSTQDWTNQLANLSTPMPAHVHDPTVGVQDRNPGMSRPIHLLRNPSFNPPPFNHEDPPPMLSPPPRYENIVAGDTQNGLADYFSRLADEMGEEDEPVNDRGRVEIPLTPGGRIHRSMDASRGWLPLGASLQD